MRPVDTNNGNPVDVLQVSEGPENGLTAWQATGTATIITLGTANYCTFDLPKTVKEIVFLVDIDNDFPGLISSLKAARYWQNKGYSVRLSFPGSEIGVQTKFTTYFLCVLQFDLCF